MLDLITSPVPGAAPLGENVNYDPAFGALKNEIQKLGNIDYNLVEENAKKVLKEKSKDVRVLSFLSFVYLRDEKWESFADVFDGFARLAATDFDGLFPDRPRAKEMGIKWLAEQRYTETLNEKKPSEADFDHIKRLAASLVSLKAVIDQKFPQASPFPANLLKSAQAWEKACTPKPKEEKPAVSAAAATTTETPKQAQDAVRKSALFLIEKEPQRPMGYRLLRAVRWELMEKLPPAADGKTQIPGPSEQQRAFFQAALTQTDWAGTLQKAEAAFASGGSHLWLDLQRVSATAAKSLGEPYKAVCDAILLDTAAFVKRLQGVAELKFADGSPCASDATKEWLAKEAAPVLSQGGAQSTVAAGGEEDALVRERRDVDALVAAGKIEDALDLLQRAINSSSNERDNFNRSIAMGALLIKAKQPDIALSLLEALGEKIEQYKLDKWEPELSVEAWSALYSAYKVVKAAKPQPVQIQFSEKQNDILGRISRINPRKAFQLPK